MSRGAAGCWACGRASATRQLSHAPEARLSPAPNRPIHAHGSSPFERACGARSAHKWLKICRRPPLRSCRP
eukprot:6198230-Pleurochrysis_carterae.AAC.1